MRQIVLDTETTGLNVEEGHRIIEIGCVELVNRRTTDRNFHRYLNPGREIEDGALAVHGLTRARLAQEPSFGDIAAELLDFIRGSELIIHNAAFDVAFLEREFALLQSAAPVMLRDICQVIDTLLLARERHPGQRNSLDALCKRYSIDNSHRQLHGALLDARILADVYLAMSGGQSLLALGESARGRGQAQGAHLPALQRPAEPLRVLRASASESAAHAELRALLAKASGGCCLWTLLEPLTAPGQPALAAAPDAGG
ncbi:MAG TPA: DNA polymerase III subunit epsilon [Steroidobacteraceae bacterium]|jgi:DNA polymerase-3 subunit epsilon